MKAVSISIILAIAISSLNAEEVDYERDIRPLLAEKCGACHGSIRQESGLRLDAGKLIHRGSDNGPVVDLQVSNRSLLLSRVTTNDADSRMPPKDEGTPLTPKQIQLLEKWIAAGAPFPAEEVIPLGPDSHWAYRTPERANVPKVSDSAWSANPIDAFILSRLQEAGLKPAPLADRRTQLRRVYLDLIGLPPTPAQQNEFLASRSDDAWFRLVDELLEDSAYGERWARHWMDIWRYSDWDGYKQQIRGSQRHIWRWRDWIIESLNEDKPYDRMIVEMLAGDEVAPADRKTLRATGFLARNYHNSNRDIWLDATVEHTSKAFLGMTINCARCHDHKYDPIGQKEYYAMRAIFEPHNVRTERIPGELNLQKNGLVRVFDAKPDASTFLYVGGNEKLADKDNPVTAETPAIIGLGYQPNSIELPPVAVFPALNSFYETEAIDAARRKLKAAEQALAGINKSDNASQKSPLNLELAQQKVALAKAELDSTIARWNADKAKFSRSSDQNMIEQLTKFAADAEQITGVERARLTLIGHRLVLQAANDSTELDGNKKQTAIDKATKEVADAEMKLKSEEAKTGTNKKYTPVGKNYPTRSTGRRLALARWITDEKNPLTARVAVNHIWLRHFGEPLVANVFDFGMRSPKPVHHELLDWLAVELIENNWSMKHIHRLIVTSRVYRSSSHTDPIRYSVNRKNDPDNQLLWKSNVRRLDAEVIRDSILHVAKSLDRKVGGPDLDQAKAATIPRRSLYFRHAYEKQVPMLVTFDAATPSECYRRSESVVPQQALALSNGPLAIEQSRILANRLNVANAPSSDFIRATFVTVLCRECSDEEMKACSVFLDRQTALLSKPQGLTNFNTNVNVPTKPSSDPQTRARQNLVHVLINHNDFVTLR